MLLRLPFTLSSALLSPPLHPHRSKPFSSLSSSPNPNPNPNHSSNTTLPLFLRPLSYSAPVSSLLSFRLWAESLALSSVDDPHLLRELSWLIDDASAHKHPRNDSLVPLRAELHELYELWRERIEKRRPFQYLVGCEHWRDLVLGVREGVLIPRPETEMVVDLVGEVEGFERGWWADLGTGSGALAIGIGRMLREDGRVFATDLSSDAVEVARFNVERYGLKDKVEIRQGSWFEPLQDVKGKLAGIVSNPPYIPTSHLPGLQPEVGLHEPRLALDGGENGMDHLLHLCEGSASALKSGGFFAFETNGDAHSEFLADLMTAKWGKFFHNIKIVLDFAGIKRFVTGYCR
ncbi:uncharacterized protein LOC109714896 [Ananas comosus]|uniref:Uncharacterized protein LOC109714896 n=1 Tax=Ananas comosus TaxID=4615 RepID=A0A6P5FGY5_ANACO|nr:uncharacterized protein LOC109714896 [Ananas comosus]